MNPGNAVADRTPTAAQPLRPPLSRRELPSFDRAMWMATEHRKTRKRDYRRLWIVRVNAASRANGMTYSRFLEDLTKAGVTLNRKIFSEMAIHDPEGFRALVERARAATAGA